MIGSMLAREWRYLERLMGDGISEESLFRRQIWRKGRIGEGGRYRLGVGRKFCGCGVGAQSFNDVGTKKKVWWNSIPR